MAQVNAGRVRFVSRGEYNNSTQYYLFDLVDYNGSSYFAKANTTGNVPTNTTYWQLVAEKGNTGGDGPVGPTGNGIASIVKTASAGLIDTYTITFTNGSTSTFNITNGQDGEVTQEYVDEENERLKSLYNVLPKVSDSGESVTLENTGDTMLYKMDLKGNTSQEVVQGEVGLEVEDTSIYVDDVNTAKENYITLKGNTYQNSTSGNQLLALKSSTYTSLGITKTVTNSSVTFSGVPERDWTNTDNISFDKPLTANTTYNISYTGNADIYLWFKNSLGTTVTSINLDTTTRSKTFTPNEEVTQYIIGINHMTVGTRVDAVVYPMLVSGSVPKDFEPYTNGASPNPDYPQEIEVVTGLNEVKVEGKNLLENTLTSQTISGVTFTKNSDGTITANGTANANIYLNLNTEVTLNAGTYILSGCPSGGSSSTYTLYENSVGYNKFDYGSGLDITLTETKTFRVSLAIYSGTSVNNLVFKPMIEKGSQATTYEAYQGASYPVNLGSIELCKIGTYQDRIYKNNGNWYLHKEIGKYVCNSTRTNAVNDYMSGTNEISKNGTYSLFLNDTSSDISNNTMYFSVAKYEYNSIITGNIDAQNNLSDNSFCMRQGTNDRIYFKNSAFTGKTGEEISPLLNGKTLFYVLITPTDTQITDTTLVNQLNALYNATIYSTTHINTETSNLLPYIDLKYNVVTASPSPDRASEVEVVTGNNTITISNENGTKTQTYNINLGSLEFCKIGDYQDYIYYDKASDKWYKYGAIGKVVLNGSENFEKSGSSTETIVVYYTTLANKAIEGYGISDKFIYSSSLENNKFDIVNYGENIRFKMSNEIYPTVQDFKNWLSNNNTIIYYPLTTPTTTQITDQLLVSQLDELQKAMSYYDKTLISQVNDDKPFIIDAIGIRDLQDIFNLISGE